MSAQIHSTNLFENYSRDNVITKVAVSVSTYKMEWLVINLINRDTADTTILLQLH